MENHSKSTNGQEAIARANRIRMATDLTHSSDFDLQRGDEYRSGHPCSYYTLQYRGVKAHLRFDYMWTVRCPSLDIEELFLNQTPDTLAREIETWIDEHLPFNGHLSPNAQLRQSTPAVKDFATKHGISIEVAYEMMLERSL